MVGGVGRAGDHSPLELLPALGQALASSPIRSSTAPVTCCSKVPLSPPTLRLKRRVERHSEVGRGPKRHPLHPARTSSHSPPLSKSLGL